MELYALGRCVGQACSSRVARAARPAASLAAPPQPTHLRRPPSTRLPAGRPPLPVFVQVNTSGEESKYGVEPEVAVALARHVHAACQNLRFAGLMTIGMPGGRAGKASFGLARGISRNPAGSAAEARATLQCFSACCVCRPSCTCGSVLGKPGSMLCFTRPCSSPAPWALAAAPAVPRRLLLAARELPVPGGLPARGM